MPVWNFRRIPSLGVLILPEVEVTEDERKQEIRSTCWQGVLVSEGRPRGPRRAGRSLPCGLCLGGKEKKSDVNRAAGSCSLISSGVRELFTVSPSASLETLDQSNRKNDQLIRLPCQDF